MNRRNILITGGAGFIGSHVVEHFVNSYPQYHIVTLDKLSYAGDMKNLSEVINAENHTFIEGDITDAKLVEELFDRYSIDGVLHLAAESHVDRSISAPMVFAVNNIIGTLTLLEAARKAWAGNFEGKRFHHISTDEVYGALDMDGGKFIWRTSTRCWFVHRALTLRATFTILGIEGLIRPLRKGISRYIRVAYGYHQLLEQLW